MAKRLVGAVLILFFLSGLGWAKDYLEPYPSPEEVYQQLDDFARCYPELVSLRKFGESVEGRPLYVLGIKATKEDLPKVLVTAGIHACEYIGVSVALAFARHILEQAEEPELRGLLEKVEIDIAPLLNPDGYARVWENKGRGGKIGTRKNARGVDLNRNFPVVPGAKSYHPLSGNRRPHSSYYMGPEPLSEPESRAVAKLVGSDGYFLAFNLHSVAGKVLYPFAYTRKPAPDKELFEQIARAFSQNQLHYHYRVQQSARWYPTKGDLDDYLYLWFGIASFTIEVSTPSSNLFDRGLSSLRIFWIANPYEKYQYWLENDVAGFIPAIEKAYQLMGGKPLPAQLGEK